MKLNDVDAYRTTTEVAVISDLLDPRGKQILELGCGAAGATRTLATDLAAAHVVATEVDRIQLEKNLEITDLPNVTCRFGGAEAIEAADETSDAVFMF